MLTERGILFMNINRTWYSFLWTLTEHGILFMNVNRTWYYFYER